MSAGLKRWKPYPEYKESGVEWLGEVPAGWEVKRFKLLASVYYGLSEPPEYQQEGTRFIRATDLHAGKIFLEAILRVDPNDIPQNKIFWLKDGDIIVVRSGAYTGDSAIVTKELEGSIAGFDMILRCAGAIPKFIQWVLLSAYMKEAQIDLQKMRAAQPHLNADQLKVCSLFSPPLHEQQAIAAFLDQQCAQIDSLIEKKQRMLDLLDEKRRAAITQAVTRGLDPTVPMKDSGVEWLGKVPEGWRLSRSMFYFDFVTSGSRAWAQFYVDSGSPFVRIGNIMRDSIQPDLSALKYVEAPIGMEAERTAIRADDIFISITADIGSVGVATSAVEGGYISQHIALCRPNRQSAHSRFLAYALSSTIGKNQLLSFSYGGTKVQLSLTDIKNIHLALPPLHEQQAIADYLDAQCAAMDSQRKNLEKSIELLREYRSSLITHAVTGKIDVRELAPLQ